jgi:hypothetical protein
MTADQYEKIIALHNAVWLAENNGAAVEANQAFLSFMLAQLDDAEFARHVA